MPKFGELKLPHIGANPRLEKCRPARATCGAHTALSFRCCRQQVSFAGVMPPMVPHVAVNVVDESLSMSASHSFTFTNSSPMDIGVEDCWRNIFSQSMFPVTDPQDKISWILFVCRRRRRRRSRLARLMAVTGVTRSCTS